MIKTFVRFCDFLFRCLSDYLKRFSAEREGFEPPEPLSSTVFKTAAIDHSAISPWSISPPYKAHPQGRVGA